MANIMQGTRFDDQGTRSEISDIAAVSDVPLEIQAPGMTNMGGPVGQAPMMSPQGGGDLDIADPVTQLANMPTDQAPITDGLSVGPGRSPALAQGVQDVARLTRLQKLAALATMAKSPHIRAQALIALKMTIQHPNTPPPEDA